MTFNENNSYDCGDIDILKLHHHFFKPNDIFKDSIESIFTMYIKDDIWYSILTVDGTKRVAIVTGSSSGIGYETALGLSRKRHR